MAVTETQRHDLHDYFEETMGRERATVMMELLPPVGWGDIATKQSLDHAVERLESKMATMATREDMYKLEARILERMNRQVLGYFGVNVGLYGATVALLTLLR